MPHVPAYREELLRLFETWKPLEEKDAFPEIEDLPARDLNIEDWEAPPRRLLQGD